ncbi:MAG TPA: hypothetical protein VEX37_05615 [Thermomicrobiales bacterium]|nr:hypothetical protein [Thermomicrobiales bacterium]
MQTLDVAREVRPRLSTDDAELLRRIDAEFTEMPGLKLTLPQAARLFSLEQAPCKQLLQALVSKGRLAFDGSFFQLSSDGR